MDDSEYRHSVADATLHIDEALDEKELIALKVAMRNDTGIVSVGRSAKDRHLMLVMYDLSEMKSIDILHRLANQGCHGELVGL